MTSRTTSALTAALVGRTVRTSLAVLAFTCGTTVATYAQTVPAPQAPASAPQASKMCIRDSLAADHTSGAPGSSASVRLFLARPPIP